MRRGNVFGRVCVCLSVCPFRALTFQCRDLQTSFLVICRYIFRVSRSSVSIKVTGSRSRWYTHAGGLHSTESQITSSAWSTMQTEAGDTGNVISTCLRKVFSGIPINMILVTQQFSCQFTAALHGTNRDVSVQWWPCGRHARRRCLEQWRTRLRSAVLDYRLLPRRRIQAPDPHCTIIRHWIQIAVDYLHTQTHVHTHIPYYYDI